MELVIAAPPPIVPVFLPRSTHWIVSVDLGQSSDPTAIAVIEHTRGVYDSNSPQERHTNTGSLPQKPGERFDVRHLERLPLGTPYPAVVQRVKDLLARPPLCGDGINQACRPCHRRNRSRPCRGRHLREAGLHPTRVSHHRGRRGRPPPAAIGGMSRRPLSYRSSTPTSHWLAEICPPAH